MITHFSQAIEESSLKKEWQQAGWKHVSMKWGIYTVA